MANVPLTRVFVYAPDPIFVARVNAASVTYPIQDIPYDGVTVGAYTDLSPDQFFTLGSAENLDDLGRGRLRAVPTATLLKVGRASQGTEDGSVDVVDNAWIHVYDDHRVHAKIPYINPSGEMWKDADLPVSDRTTNPPPVANTSPGFADTIDPSTSVITAFFEGSTSVAIADAATISSYAWDIKDGTFINATSATDADIYATFPAGFRWVALTVTDSNGNTHSARCPVFARDPAADETVPVQIESHSRNQAGTRISFRLLEDLPRATYPDGALVLCFEDGDPAPESRSHMKFIGWHQSDRASVRSTETALLRDTILECVDVAGRLDTLPGFPQTIEADSLRDVVEFPSITWAFMTTPTMDKYIHYLLQWHSTALDLADYFPSGTGSAYPFIIFQSDGQTLYEQVNKKARQFVPDHNFTCNRLGQLSVIVDPMLQEVADRTATIQASFVEQSWSDLDFTYTRPPRVHTLRASALLTGTTEPLGTAFSIAPGTAPSQGTQEQIQGEQLAKSQTDLNNVTGHRYARMNARHGLLTITSADGDDQDVDPADMTWVYLYFSDDTAPQRGFEFDTAHPLGALRALPREVEIRRVFDNNSFMWTQEAVITLELETVGRPALTEERDEALDVGDVPPPLETEPFDSGLVAGVNQVATVLRNRRVIKTSDFQTSPPTWAATAALGDIEDWLDWVVDPFSPGYITGTGAINGWVVTESQIYRIEDLFATTPTLVSQYTFASPIDHLASGDQSTRVIQASFGAFFESNNPWLMVATYYDDAATGKTGVHIVYSKDAGATWSSEIQVSSHRDIRTGAFITQIGLHLSSKQFGRAYVGAFVDEGVDNTVSSNAKGFVTTDWGETWTEMTDPNLDLGNSLGYDFHAPWATNPDEKLVYFGHTIRPDGSNFRTLSIRKADGTTITNLAPIDGAGRSYGPLYHNFGVRAYDSDRNFMAFAGFCVELSGSTGESESGVFVSSDGGTNWTEIYHVVSPLDPIVTRVAFAGDNSNILFMHGREIFKYTDDFGATIQDKEGNLLSFSGTERIIGIAGGATGV